MKAASAAELAAVKSEVADLRVLVERLLAGDDADDPTLSIAQVAKLTGRGHEAVRLWCHRGLGHHNRALRRYRIRRSELIAFMIKEFGAARLPFSLRPHLDQSKQPGSNV